MPLEARKSLEKLQQSPETSLRETVTVVIVRCILNDYYPRAGDAYACAAAAG